MFSSWLLVGVLLLPQGNDDPISKANAAVATAEAAHGKDSLEVAAELVKLAALLGANRDYANGLTAAKRALAIREALLPAGTQKTTIARINVGAMHVGLHDVEAALPCFEQARAELASQPPGRAMLGAIVNLGICQVMMGRYRDALATLEEGVGYARQHAPGHPYEASALQNLAQVRLNLADMEGAKALLEETIALYKSTGSEAQQAHAVASLAYVLLSSGRTDEAEPVLARSVQLLTKLHGSDSKPVAYALTGQGMLAMQRGDLPQAIALLEQVVAMAGRRGDVDLEGRAMSRLADAHLRAGNVEQAIALSERALAKRTPHGNSGGTAVRGMEVYGRALAANGRHAEALPVLQEARQISDREGMALSLEARDTRSVLADCLLATGASAAAFDVLSTNLTLVPEVLARTLPALREDDRLGAVMRYRRDLDRLLDESARRPDLCPPERAYRHVALWKGQVARAIQALQVEARRNPENLGRLRRLQEIAGKTAIGLDDEDMRRERERLETLLARASRPIAPTVDVGELRRALPPDGAIVDYVLQRADSGPRFIAFVIRREGVQRFDVGPEAAVSRAVTSHVQLLARCTKAGTARLIAPLAAAVRKAVFDPVTAGLTDIRRLWISADDVIATLPFAALPGAREDTFLVEDLEISYLMNAADLLTAAPANALPANVVAFGAIDYGGSAEAVAMRGVPRPFGALPQTGRELAAIEQACAEVPCRVVRGGEATEAALRQNAIGTAYIHLATHGFCGHADGRDAVSAGLALAFANEPAGDDDGILTVGEAMFLELGSCQLIVLSACDTGLGTPFAGESLLGLRRALRIAGAQASLTSVWRVEDEATATLMADFYRELLVGRKPPATALRDAQLKALDEARKSAGEGLPGLWGAFVLEGAR